jgi:hypothetical protein
VYPVTPSRLASFLYVPAYFSELEALIFFVWKARAMVVFKLCLKRLLEVVTNWMACLTQRRAVNGTGSRVEQLSIYQELWPYIIPVPGWGRRGETVLISDPALGKSVSVKMITLLSHVQATSLGESHSYILRDCIISSVLCHD